MGVRENLVAARALIDTPEKWGKGDGRKCMCAVDACFAVYDAQAAYALDNATPAGFGGGKAKLRPAADFNDHPDTTHADILALFDRAIAACTTEQVA